MNVLERFLNYVVIPTMADPSSQTCPSTECQKDLGRYLVGELLELGLTDAAMDDNGYVMATLPSNLDYEVPTIGFVAHMDTSPDLTSVGILPRVINNYDGNDILLCQEDGTKLSPQVFPELTNYIGQDLVVTDGKTLLGADNKAGIAEIMAAAAYLIEHPEIPHGSIKIGFTPDEEIGRGGNLFDVEAFGADFAYTLDGGIIGELEYQSFNANNTYVTIHGRNVHPGTAKGQMVNSMSIAIELDRMLPPAERPEFTSGYEGYFHLHDFKGDVETTKLFYLIRDFDKAAFEERKRVFMEAVNFLNGKYGEGTVEVSMNDMYYNMKDKIEPVFEIVDLVRDVMLELGIQPIIKGIRGGTDGSKLSYKGLPCPNIFAGGHNYHGKYEYIPVQSMEMAVKVVLGVIGKFAEKKQ